ncbi:hypothetical protein [Bradyrhizobium sp.]|uniref:hypothetical protein n=1 Tax=Bradyrhizobium sp. TaxID=376 RepID=UPI002618D7A3|nr:hypothetical protein [Bradyrhizobium sp.]
MSSSDKDRPTKYALLGDLLRLSAVPAVGLPLWILGISTFSYVGILPAGIIALSAASRFLLLGYRKRFEDRPTIEDISTKLILMCWASGAVSLIFLAFQFTAWIWITRYSPTLDSLTRFYNAMPMETINSMSKRAALLLRISLLALLFLTFAFAPLLSVGAARFSKSLSRFIDVGIAALLTATLFAFYGAESGGLNSVLVVLRDEEAKVRHLYRDAISKASQDILAKAVYAATKAQQDAVQSANSNPPTPGGGRDSAPPNRPSPSAGSPSDLNSWDKGIYKYVLSEDDRILREVARETREKSIGKKSAGSEVPPPSANKSGLEAIKQLDIPLEGLSGSAVNVESVEQMTKVALDAAELPAVMGPEIVRLTSETVVGAGVKDVVELLSDSAFQDGLRSMASQFVNELLTTTPTPNFAAESARKYATKLLNTPTGQMLAERMRSLQDYGAKVVERVLAFRLNPGDRVLARAEQLEILDTQHAIRGLAVMPDHLSSRSIENLENTSKSISDGYVESIARSTKNRTQLTESLATLRQRAASASTPREKSDILKSLETAAASIGARSSTDILCRCVNTRTRAVVYSFFTEQRLCQTGLPC